MTLFNWGFFQMEYFGWICSENNNYSYNALTVYTSFPSQFVFCLAVYWSVAKQSDYDRIYKVRKVVGASYIHHPNQMLSLFHLLIWDSIEIHRFKRWCCNGPRVSHSCKGGQFKIESDHKKILEPLPEVQLRWLLINLNEAKMSLHVGKHDLKEEWGSIMFSELDHKYLLEITWTYHKSLFVFILQASLSHIDWFNRAESPIPKPPWSWADQIVFQSIKSFFLDKTLLPSQRNFRITFPKTYKTFLGASKAKKW